MGSLTSWGWVVLPKLAFGVAPPIGVLSMGSGEGCCLLGLGDCLGTSVGEMVAVGCSSMGEVLCGEMSGDAIEVFAQVGCGMRPLECF